MKKYITKIAVLAACLALTAGIFTGCSKNENGDLINIGVLQYAAHPSLDNCREGFIEGLKQEGYVDGENIKIDYQNADNKGENTNMIAQNFVAKNYKLIAAIATPAAIAVQAAAQDKDIPVVFTAVSDPVAAKVVASLDAPGKGATGTADALPLEEQMKMIRAFMPDAKKIGILYTTNEVNSATHLKLFEGLAPKYGFEIVASGISSPSDIPLAVDALLPQVDCINNFTDNNVVNNLETLITKANEKKIPVFGSEEEQVKKGCVASQSINYYNLGIETGKMAAKALKGEDVSGIPVEVISDSRPVANESAMKALGLFLPDEYKDTIEFIK